MRLKHLKTIHQPAEGSARIACLAFSPNGKKLAICTSERVVQLYDDSGERKDKFATKPSDSKYSKNSYHVTAIAFGPDSAKLAVAQTDNIIYVYKIGENWGDKKVICNKFPQQSAVTAMIWPPEQQIIFGLAEGKVRLANTRNNKSSTLYSSESLVVSLASNLSGKGFVSGHADGQIVRYFFEDEGTGETSGKLCVHPSAPYALCWAGATVVAAGSDKRIYAYTREGRPLQQFDYSRDDNEKEFTVACCSPSGQTVVVGSFNRIRLLNWSPSKGTWEEGAATEIDNLYTVTALAWRRDGSRIASGSLCGAVDVFDCSTRRAVYKDKFDVKYVGPSQVLVTEMKTGRKIVIKSHYGCEVNDLKVMGNDKYLIAYTTETLIIADIKNERVSEVPWTGVGNEKFLFDYENVCVIFHDSTLSMIEYGQHQVLGSVRTENFNPHLISVRINERKQLNVSSNRKLAYLMDLKTVCIFDLDRQCTIGQVDHDVKVHWLELNETSRKLLFRDKKLRLFLYDVDSSERIALLNYCSYVQWVPGSDVVVAQSRDTLCIWYNVDSPDRITSLPLKGDIIGVERLDGKTNVIVRDGAASVNYMLDEDLIEFGTSMDDGDFGRAAAFLESQEQSPEVETMWKTLADAALRAGSVTVAERSYAALGDVCKARYLRQVDELVQRLAAEGEPDPLLHYQVQAKLALLDRDFKRAEQIYLEQNAVDEAIEMYKSMQRWELALEVAMVKNHPELEQLKKGYLDWLSRTNQEEKVGEMKEREGDYQGAISFYLKSGLPGRAAQLALSRDELRSNNDLMSRIATALERAELFEKAGELFERIGNNTEAMKCYRRAKAFLRAVDLARHAYPSEVVRLEEEWGNYLAMQKQMDAAVQHFIEAGVYTKAVDAAIGSRQWLKAVEILRNMGDAPNLKPYYEKLAIHFASTMELDIAEQMYVQAGNVKQAIAMYTDAGRLEDAHRLANSHMDRHEFSQMYTKQADEAEAAGRYKEAEKLFLTIGQVDRAIRMYRNARMHHDTMRLVRQHDPANLAQTQAAVAAQLAEEGNHRQAEQFFLEAGDWKAAVKMYRQLDMWEDAYRVAKNHGEGPAAKQVAYYWARHLGGESAVKLLTRFGLLESAIDTAIENSAFDFAFELSKNLMQHKTPEIHLKYAMFLEDEGKFAEAEEHFIKANKPKEAVLMHVHARNWDAARRVAEKHDKGSIPDILAGQARLAFEEKEFQKAEALLLRAERPELAVKFYKEAGMKTDALRVCKEYLPHKLAQLSEELEYEATAQKADGIQNLIREAKQYEASGNHLKAVEMYLKLTTDVTNDESMLAGAWRKAADLAVKFLSADKHEKVVDIVANRLKSIGRHADAAEVYLRVEMVQECVDAYISAEDWSNARRVAKQLEPRLNSYIETKYKESLTSAGNAQELAATGDVGSAVDMLAAKGQWEKCLAMAEKQDYKLLHKYVAMYATNLIKEGNTEAALTLYVKHGAPAFQQNYNIYRKIFKDVISMRDMCKPGAYPIWADLRDFLLNLVHNLEKSSDRGSQDHELFDQLLTIGHYCAIRSAMLSDDSLKPQATKVAISLLRYTEYMPADKAFYEAGIMCKSIGWDNMAFVFLNHYLDLIEAIEDQDDSSLNHSDFEGTDIPAEVPLPASPHTNSTEYEEVKAWILEVSMNQRMEQTLPKDNRGIFEASLIGGQMSPYPPCVITGYPVLETGVQFKRTDKTANKDDYNKMLTATKMSHSVDCQDVLKFITNWCGNLPMPTYSFK
ncbi:hypothetical protein BOX15_Mlig006435g1 [Macrostomum lignano]|uniref:WD_REPEATS_REGION domain-containing protein n=2 Tax=Macrostomum lignano TaxID=282301 RepID=A0A267DWA8_9PLAT|nr:hypothetical protein BOX15_Mlig006435g1 [Macrostomum lignano]